MKILVVDDEPLARARMLALLADVDHVSEVSEAPNGLRALEQINDSGFDVVLLDIRMPGMDGLEVARHILKLEIPPTVIFTTAYEQHALEAFDLNAIGYLVKPVKKTRLLHLLKTAQQLTAVQVQDIQPEQERYISARIGSDLQLVPLTDVYYFRADQKYVLAVHKNGELLLEDTLKSLEDRFSEHFLRIHRNALVALNAIQSLHKQADGKVQVMLHGVAEPLEISRRHLPQVRQLIKARCS
ncbi:MAG: response regulator transcription factor [Enterobacterales bacterium]|nr:response regulator transcription factor [Enterobacterales bacterium]